MFYPKTLLSTGIFLLFFAVIWVFLITDEFEKLDQNYYHYEEQSGMNSLINENGELSEPFPHHNIYEIKVVNISNDNMKITSSLIATNTDTGEVFLDETRFFDVNARTKAHQSIEKGFFVFPAHVEKKDYFLTFPLAFTQGIFSFVQETEIQGLSVYEFDCISEPYDITNAITLFRDSIVKSIYNCKIWVEPLTGQHVDFNLNWESYFEEDGKLTTLVEKGSKKTTSEYVEKLVKETKTKSLISNIVHYFAPFIFLIIGSFFVTYSYLKRTKELEKTIGVQTLELIKAEKLAIIGTLSSRVTHDIRNPLSVIKISSDLIKKQLVDSKIVDSIITEKIELIQDSVERITHQVDDVLDFVRRRPVKLGKIMISEIIRESLDTLNISNNVELILPKKDVEILCDKRQFSVVMNNLILNGIQAIDSIGTIEIAVEEDNDVIIIQVKDSGKGISKEDLDKIFEPLFTTKQEGTGLGLVSVISIIKGHNGTISVTSPPTIFTITLPKTS